MATILLTDYAWAELEIERSLVEAAGFRLIAGPPQPGSEAEIEALVRRHDPAAIITNWAPVSAVAIAGAPALRIVARLGVGLDNIAVEAATARGIWVSNVPDYCIEEVSDHALALLLALVRGVVAFDRGVKADEWAPETARLRRVRTLTVGILGYGRIGRRTAEKLQPFGCRLLALRRGEAGDDGLVERRDLVELLALSDAVISHLPLTAETRHLIDDARLALMRPGSFLVNVSRGAVVENGALERALDAGILAGAALDVVEGEPQPPTSLVLRPNVIVTPHIGFSSAESVAEVRRRAVADVLAALEGRRPAGACNRPAGIAG